MTKNKKLKPTVITSAYDSLSSEQKGRQRRYFISMMVRTLCFIASIFLPNPYRWFSMGLAIVLPYIAVVLANAGRESIVEANTIISKKAKVLELE